MDAGQAGKGEPHDAFDRLFLQWEEANDPALRGSDDVKELLDPRSLASEAAQTQADAFAGRSVRFRLVF